MATSENSSPAPERGPISRHEANGNQCAAHTRGRPTVNEPSYRPRNSVVRHNLLLPPPTVTIHS